MNKYIDFAMMFIYLMMKSGIFRFLKLHFVVMLIGSHQIVPESKLGAKVSSIVRVMEIVILSSQFPREKRKLPPTELVPTMVLACLYQSID